MREYGWRVLPSTEMREYALYSVKQRNPLRVRVSIWSVCVCVSLCVSCSQAQQQQQRLEPLDPLGLPLACVWALLCSVPGKMASQLEKSNSADELKPVEEQGTTEKSSTGDAKETADFSAASVEPSSSTSSYQEPPLAARKAAIGAPFLDTTSAPPCPCYVPVFTSNPNFIPSIGGMPAFVHPSVLPGYLQPPVSQEQQFQHGGVYAVPLVPIIAPMVVFPPGGLVPVSLNIDGTVQGTASTVERSSDGEGTAPNEAREGPVAAGLRPRYGPPAQAAHIQRAEAQRQLVRRFHVGFQLDLLLILKLAVVVFVFNQDGSRDRLLLLLFLAGLVYLYQTGALAPFLQWISQSAQRAMIPPQQPLQAGQGRQAGPDVQLQGGGGNVQNEGDAAGAALADARDAPANAGAVGELRGQGAAAAAVGAREHVEQAAQGPTWWGFLKEIQMIVVGFVTSLLPGFQHVD
eukprot:c28468_g5_i1 orf=999-2381(-)